MGINAVVTFIDANNVCDVYVHGNAYPENINQMIENAKEYAFKFPRFEASDFAAAFIAANKTKGGGNIYFGDEDMEVDYSYTVSVRQNKFRIDFEEDCEK